MLLQRMRSADLVVEAAIAYNLVDLALSSPAKGFSDIIRAFSLANQISDPDDPRQGNNMVLVLKQGVRHL